MTVAITDRSNKAFHADLSDLTRMIAEMGGYAERQLVEAIDALTRGDRAHGRRVVLADTTMDSQQRDVETKAIATIATRQPMAGDLRKVIGILRIANELERIGDLAKNIGKRVEGLNGEIMPRKVLRGITHITDLALHLLRDALDSFAERDGKKAIDVRNRDEGIDSLYTSLFRELLAYMMEDPGTMAFGIHLLFCAKNIERMGDHATNIAEAVYFMVEGHPFADERPKADTTSGMKIAFNISH